MAVGRLKLADIFQDSMVLQRDKKSVFGGMPTGNGFKGTAGKERSMREHENEPVIPMGPYHFQRPAGLYHNMVSKTAPYTIKAFCGTKGKMIMCTGIFMTRPFGH